MQDIYYQEKDLILLTMKEIYYGITLVPKKYHHNMVLKIKDVIKEFPYSIKIKYNFLTHSNAELIFVWDTAVPSGSENSHNVVQLNPDEDKYYLLAPYPTLMQPLKKFSPEVFTAIACNPNIDLLSIGILSKSYNQHHIRTQQFQELLTKINTKNEVVVFLGWPYYILER